VNIREKKDEDLTDEELLDRLEEVLKRKKKGLTG
jgi:hypothetical protein